MLPPALKAQPAPSSGDLEHQKAMLAAKRRILEREMAELLARSKHLKSPNDSNDGYEVIRFNDEEDEHHYLTPICNLKHRKSISDSDLAVRIPGNEEDREIEVLCGANRDATFSMSEPEQGFYRVYDDLDRVREWDLIPYVITRKMKEAEALKNKVKEIEKRQEGSRISLDSGRASIVSGNTGTRSKRMHSDSGSNCSADSGTYNLFDEYAKDEMFLQKASLQLNSIRAGDKSLSLIKKDEIRSHHHLGRKQKKFRAPPPVPDQPPPPIPPRSRTSSTTSNTTTTAQKTPALIKRKDLSSYFGLLEDEPNQLQSKEVAHTVSLQNLSASLKEDLFKSESERKKLPEALLKATTPPGRKDLNR
jgi:hypothetical protein